ncbi:hypothetical protein LZ554_002651 [Drepanopeziza brunnea f. sp. 'monogermtubi']|nr:hypothetical protein LZ554_002651 [Drepanopeziza brunnea f. sp. 'monogermtubi']
MATPRISPLPQGASYVELHCLDGGSFIADRGMVHAGGSGRFRMYTWAFYAKDKDSGRHVLWDVGINQDLTIYPPVVQKLLKSVDGVGPRKSLAEQLEKRGIGAHQIDSVLFRPIDAEFPAACGYFGPGTEEHCAPGHLSSPEANATVQWDGQFFDPVRRTQRWEELRGPWVRFGPFDKAMDFFGNGSLWIVQAPGHMPGNLCAVAHVDGDQWVLLGSDCCHSRRLLDGLEDFGSWHLPDGCRASLQADEDAARDTIRRIRIIEADLHCHVALAHDEEWMVRGTDPTLMALVDDEMRAAARELIPLGKPL